VLYQVHTKLRDEPRPRFGVLRTREFVMKDAYSFSRDEAGLEACYTAMREAYGRLFERCGLSPVVAEADPGAMGGGESHEFIVPARLGAASFVRCGGCDYAASFEAFPCGPPAAAEPPAELPGPREVETPGLTTVEQVGRFLDVGPERIVKTMLYVADAEPVAALVRGDHEVSEAKLRRELGVGRLELAGAEMCPGAISRSSGSRTSVSSPGGTNVGAVAERLSSATALRSGTSSSSARATARRWGHDSPTLKAGRGPA
jgi:prolyl-tRNA synthetase